MDAKLEFLELLGYDGSCILHDDSSLSEEGYFLDDDTLKSLSDHKVAQSNVRITDLNCVKEDEESCLPSVYDPTFFIASTPPTPRSRSDSSSQPPSLSGLQKKLWFQARRSHSPPRTTKEGATEPVSRLLDSLPCIYQMATPSASSRSLSHPSFGMLPKILITPSLASSDSLNAFTASTLVTSIESAHPTLPFTCDPFRSDAPSFKREEVEEEEEANVTPHDLPQAHHESHISDCPMYPTEPPPQPTLPPPSPAIPSFSFVGSSSQFTRSIVFGFIQKKRMKKLVISGALWLNQPPSSSAQCSENLGKRKKAQKWCEGFGSVKKFMEEEGSLHVYWKCWETADMVCRIRGDVCIAGVGTVNLDWAYID